jgi:hypothetical protein
MHNLTQPEQTMYTYLALYKNKRITVTADTSYAAQLQAAKLFKAKKAYEVSVYLADTAISTASI